MKVVFLGDSITDAGRNTTNGSMVSIGQSYPLILDAKLSVSEPGKYEFINTGVSGSRIVISMRGSKRMRGMNSQISLAFLSESTTSGTSSWSITAA